MTDGTVDPLLVAEPITAWKAATIQSDDPFSCFRPLFKPVAYGVDDTAVCVPLARHDAPQCDCQCGFYALRTPIDALERVHGGYLEHALLKVELSGRVIEHEGGFRAQRQRVVAVWASARILDYAEALPVDAHPLEESEHWRAWRYRERELCGPPPPPRCPWPAVGGG